MYETKFSTNFMAVPFFGLLTCQKTVQPSTNVAVGLLADNFALDST